MPTRVPRWARNPRRAYDREGIEIEPVTIGDLRRGGITALRVYCRSSGCHHHAIVPVADWPEDIAVPDADLRLRCSACGTRHDAQIIPDWREWRARAIS